MTSPNFGPRRENARPDLVVIHYTAMADCAAAERTLCNPELEVSAHYLISEGGEVIQLVPEDQRAWHAGAGQWGSVTDVNSRSIGIELSNIGTAPFAAKQMDALEDLLRGIVDRWDVRPERVIGHSDLAPHRKIDPGARFDWNRLARQGLAIRAAETEVATDDLEGDLLNALRNVGYADHPLGVLLPAFRLRHRQRYDGPADLTDLRLASYLAETYPAL
ncbi:N-acetylmuramoyl-L-alanine amidase [Marivivens donghaensis]|uniref:N-acetylmuramoyl-L-alanine amidase n=1 Tax=Marivivens donghaensis TaxID=1699413 RepID=UPI0032B1657C